MRANLKTKNMVEKEYFKEEIADSKHMICQVD